MLGYKPNREDSDCKPGCVQHLPVPCDHASQPGHHDPQLLAPGGGAGAETILLLSINLIVIKKFQENSCLLKVSSINAIIFSFSTLSARSQLLASPPLYFSPPSLWFLLLLTDIF